MDTASLFFILFVVGLLLIGAEVFVPGGILGSLGAVTLLAAIVSAYYISPAAGLAATGAGAVLTIVSLVLWIRLFPGTRIGKQMTLAQDGRDFKSAQDGLTELLNREGDATSDLRPAGFASIDGRRIDVVSEGGMITRGARVRVVAVEGNRVIVRIVAPAAANA